MMQQNKTEITDTVRLSASETNTAAIAKDSKQNILEQPALSSPLKDKNTKQIIQSPVVKSNSGVSAQFEKKTSLTTSSIPSNEVVSIKTITANLPNKSDEGVNLTRTEDTATIGGAQNPFARFFARDLIRRLQRSLDHGKKSLADVKEELERLTERRCELFQHFSCSLQVLATRFEVFEYNRYEVRYR